MIKSLSSQVDLETGENRHTMILGSPDTQMWFSVELDARSYMNIGAAVQQILDGAPARGRPQAQMPDENSSLREEVFGRNAPMAHEQDPWDHEQDSMARAVSEMGTEHLRGMLAKGEPSEVEARLEAQLRALEASSGGEDAPREETRSPEDLLREVGWFADAPEPPNDALGELFGSDEAEDPGEDYPEDDGVEAI